MKLYPPQAVPAGHLAAFAGGFLALWIAVASPIAHLDHHLLTAHMVQHLLLMLVAAPLILVGSRSMLLRARIVRIDPVFCWLAGSLTVIGWHVPAAFELALRSPYWHGFEQATFFIAGLLFWWPVIQPIAIVESSRWSVPIYLFLATLPCDALSAFLVFCGHVVYPHYMSGHGSLRLSPLDDQALAGSLMWVTVTFAYLIPALVVTTQLLSGERRSGERRRTAEIGVC